MSPDRTHKRIETLEAAIAKVKGFVAEHQDKLGTSGKPIKSVDGVRNPPDFGD